MKFGSIMYSLCTFSAIGNSTFSVVKPRVSTASTTIAVGTWQYSRSIILLVLSTAKLLYACHGSDFVPLIRRNKSHYHAAV